MRLSLWEHVTRWEDIVYEWKNVNFESLNADEIQQTIAKYLKNVIQFEKNFPPNEVVPELRKKVEATKKQVSCISQMFVKLITFYVISSKYFYFIFK